MSVNLHSFATERDNPLMCAVLSMAEFIQANITFNEVNKGQKYPYLFNVVPFNDIKIEWINSGE